MVDLNRSVSTYNFVVIDLTLLKISVWYLCVWVSVEARREDRAPCDWLELHSHEPHMWALGAGLWLQPLPVVTSSAVLR